MSACTLDIKKIELLRDIPDLIPVRRDNFENRTIRVINRAQYICRNYLSANRREFYKIVFLNEGKGIFTLGTNTYNIEEPTILFIHPNEIISWKNLAQKSTGYFCIFNKRYFDKHPALASTVNTYDFFLNPVKSVISLKKETAETVDDIFKQMHEAQKENDAFAEDALQAYIQLIVVTCNKNTVHPVPDVISSHYKRIYQFFRLLEKETINIHCANPVRIKTAQEYAIDLHVHPNYLNALLKKHTGQNVSTHIKNRLLEKSKILLLQTDLTLQNIGYAIGFADQPNFSLFFKKNTGITPTGFRKSYGFSDRKQINTLPETLA